MILTSDKFIARNLDGSVLVNLKTINDFEGNDKVKIIVASRALLKQVELMNFPNLKLVQLTSAGFDGIDIDVFRKKGVYISNSGDLYSDAMAEFIVFSILKLVKRFNANIKNGRFRFLRNYKHITELKEKTVGILGVGSIGKEVANRLNGFKVNIIGCSRNQKEAPNFSQIFNSSELDKFLTKCDFLILTIPLNEQTKNYFDRTKLNMLKKDAAIISVSRTEVFNTKHLFSFLKQNKRNYAVLDMFEILPNPITNPFRRLSNVLVLPGVTAISDTIDMNKLRMVRINTELIEKNLTPENIIN